MVKQDRSLLTYVLLSIVTCGIYSWIFLYELAKDVNIHIKAEMYSGQLPDTAVRSEYSSSDSLLAKIMFCRLGVWLVERIYRAKGQDGGEKGFYAESNTDYKGE